MPTNTRSKTKAGKFSKVLPEIKFLIPHTGGQRAIYKHPARFQVVACGRRFGKTALGKLLALECMLRLSGHVAWISPTTKMSTNVWREFLESLGPHAKWVSAQEKTLVLPGDGKITFWTAENEDALRGQAFDLVIMDEAAMYKSNALWDSVIRPALGDRKGKAFFFSTPRGRNWFYDVYKLGLNDKHNDYQSWRFPSEYNPFYPKEEIELARLTTPERFFQQEYMAEFLLDAGEVFKGVNDVSILETSEPYEGSFVFGIDLARKDDFTCISIIDIDSMKQVDLIRVNYMTWTRQKDVIWREYEKWKPELVIVEENAAGGPIIESLQEDGMEVQGFFTSGPSKKDIIDDLALAIETKDILLLNELIQINELQAYQMTRTNTGKVKYNSPYGTHDDTVMSLALSYYAAKRASSSFGSKIPRIA